MNTVFNKLLWFLFGFLAIGVGLYPLLYFIVGRNFGLLGGKSDALLGSAVWNTGFYGHILLGGLALMVGWLQFSKKLRTKNIGLHRTIGKIYVLAVGISGICGLYIGYFASGGWISSIGFMSLAIIWLSTTGLAYYYIKNGNIVLHQKMMIYSYAACFAAVTLRLWLPNLIALHDGDFIPAYRIVAYLCWVPNIIIAFFIARKVTG